jgi:hypothetical protein
MGSVGFVVGPATLTNAAGQTSLAEQSQLASGSEVQTGSNAIVGVTSSDGTLQLWENSGMVWVGVQQQSLPGQPVSLKALQVPPVPYDYIMSSWEGDGLVDEGLGPLGLFLGGVLSISEGFRAIVVDGLIFVGEGGLGHFDFFSDSQNGVGHVEPVVVPQGFIVSASDPEFTVSVSNQTTILQVLSGAVAFLDPVTNNTVTIGQGQMLTLPNQQGFTQQELNSDTSSFDSSSINQWWAQATASPTASATATPSGSNDFMGIPLDTLLPFVPVVAIVFVAVVAVSANAARKRKARDKLQSGEMVHASYSKKAFTQKPQTPQAAVSAPMVPLGEAENQQDNEKTVAATAAPSNEAFLFCPNCGKQLPVSRKFCPYCGFNLSAR